MRNYLNDWDKYFKWATCGILRMGLITKHSHMFKGGVKEWYNLTSSKLTVAG